MPRPRSRWPKQKVSPSGRYADPSPPPLSSSRTGSDSAQHARSSSNSAYKKQIAGDNAGMETMQSRGRRNRRRPKRHKPSPSLALRSYADSTTQEGKSPRKRSRAQKHQESTLMGGKSGGVKEKHVRNAIKVVKSARAQRRRKRPPEKQRESHSDLSRH